MRTRSHFDLERRAPQAALTLQAGARTAAITCLAIAATWAVSAARLMQDADEAGFKAAAPVALWPAHKRRLEAAQARAADEASLEAARALLVKALPPPPPQELERDFTRLAALDAQTLDAGDLRIRLTDLPPPPAGDCRRLDGVSEPCSVRATTRLDLNVRWKTVNCRYHMEGPGLAAGTCRVGGVSLASRLEQSSPARTAMAQ
ncbi:hypothetical protein SLNSH_17635 [Alsobacter soli]|uniref:Uncharacterized protein n=1 Tax=Alsobacter soli TaxID=2109933 RepID=A0A2T1HQ46_9HYPH|nr:hypothetical protein [Alsobacter soli]PSC03763.1 hypothetical protein SLNSH_17635 [Alsobacter soli]